MLIEMSIHNRFEVFKVSKEIFDVTEDQVKKAFLLEEKMMGRG